MTTTIVINIQYGDYTDLQQVLQEIPGKIEAAINGHENGLEYPNSIVLTKRYNDEGFKTTTT